jgi:hypothetical protein
MDGDAVGGKTAYVLAEDPSAPGGWTVTGRNGKGLRMSPYESAGYRRLNLAIEEGGKRKSFFLHHLALWTFGGPSPGTGYTLDHIDRCKTNNALSNLRWATHAEQNNNLTRRGKYTPSVIVSFEQLKADGVQLRRVTEIPGGVGEMPTPYSGFPALFISVCGGYVIRQKTDGDHSKGPRRLTPMVNGHGRPYAGIAGTQYPLHVLQWQLSNPGARRPPVIEHLNDNPLDFSAANLITSTFTANAKRAHDNNKYDGTRGSRVPVVLRDEQNIYPEQTFQSLSACAAWLRSEGFDKVTRTSAISFAAIWGFRITDRFFAAYTDAEHARRKRNAARDRGSLRSKKRMLMFASDVE